MLYGYNCSCLNSDQETRSRSELLESGVVPFQEEQIGCFWFAAVVGVLF